MDSFIQPYLGLENKLHTTAGRWVWCGLGDAAGVRELLEAHEQVCVGRYQHSGGRRGSNPPLSNQASTHHIERMPE